MLAKWKEASDPAGDFITFRTEVRIKPYKVKVGGKTYHYGKIQLNVGKKWIGHRAKISVWIQE